MKTAKMLIAVAIALLGAFELCDGIAVAAAHKHHKHHEPPEPVAAQPVATPEAAEDAAATAASARAASEPVKLELTQSALGWLKRCPDPTNAKSCTVDASFVALPVSPPTMELSIDLISAANTHTVRVLLPLDLQLRSGFALTFGGKDAYLGTFSLCRRTGCLGDVVLSDAVFDALMKANAVDIIVSNSSGRTVSIEAPLAGMKDVAGGPSLTAEELKARQKDALEKTQAAADAYIAKVKAEKEAKAQATGAAPPPATEPPPAASAPLPGSAAASAK